MAQLDRSPNSFRSRRRDKAALGFGWAVALLLHVGLLLAVIFEGATPVPSVPSRASVSLVLQAAEPSRPAAAVAPRLPEILPERPKTVPVMIANVPPIKPRTVPKAKLLATNAAPMPAGQPAARPQNLVPQPAGSQGFVAAAPAGGDANPPPEYPEAAIEHGEQGRILLSIHVLPDGTADFVSVTQGSGYRILDQAAQAAVLHWRFRPASFAGRPVVQVIPFWINFDLETQTVRQTGTAPPDTAALGQSGPDQ